MDLLNEAQGLRIFFIFNKVDYLSDDDRQAAMDRRPSHRDATAKEAVQIKTTEAELQRLGTSLETISHG